MYQPYEQAPPRAVDFVVRAKNGGTGLLATMRAEAQELDPTVPVEHLETMTQKIVNQTSGLRYVAQLMAIFGAVASILSVVGVYGVIAYSINERRREIGIRMALGAQSRDVLRLLMRSGISLTMSGILIGVVLALALARLIAAEIYGVSSWDASAFLGVPALLAAIALIANYIPSRRAARVDPMIALRFE